MGCCSEFTKVNRNTYDQKVVSDTSHVWLLEEYFTGAGCKNGDTLEIDTQEDFDRLMKWFKDKLSVTFLEAGSYDNVYELEKLYMVYAELIEEEFNFEEECLLFWHGW